MNRYTNLSLVKLFLFILLASCVAKRTVKPLPFESNVMEKEIFIAKPFGYAPTIKNFSTYLPASYKTQVYSMKNIHNPTLTDTIYKFYKKKTELLVLKSAHKRELFFSGSIYDHHITLQNGVTAGMTRKEFFGRFTDLKPTTKDTVRLSSKQALNSVNFIFNGDKLKVVKFDCYID
jgi:hypothetical protein